MSLAETRRRQWVTSSLSVLDDRLNTSKSALLSRRGSCLKSCLLTPINSLGNCIMKNLQTVSHYPDCTWHQIAENWNPKENSCWVLFSHATLVPAHWSFMCQFHAIRGLQWWSLNLHRIWLLGPSCASVALRPHLWFLRGPTPWRNGPYLWYPERRRGGKKSCRHSSDLLFSAFSACSACNWFRQVLLLFFVFPSSL